MNNTTITKPMMTVKIPPATISGEHLPVGIIVEWNRSSKVACRVPLVPEGSRYLDRPDHISSRFQKFLTSSV